jgi:hypothetical protein
MKECALQNIPNLGKLSCHVDLIDVISRTQQATQGMDTTCMITHVYINLFSVDENANSSFFSLSNAVVYKKGYNIATKTGNICQVCYNASAKDKIPMFSAANKMWLGDVPPVLQQLTIAEEKL